MVEDNTNQVRLHKVKRDVSNNGLITEESEIFMQDVKRSSEDLLKDAQKWIDAQ